MRIIVAGGTGLVGRHVVSAAAERGHDVAALSRRSGVDVLTGTGLEAALTGADAVIDVTNVTTLSAKKATAFFETATRNLLAAEAAAGVGQHVALSIVGIDDIDAMYYAGKLAQERAVEAGSVPYTIARVTQFHEFAGQLLAAMRGPVRRAPDLVGPRDEELIDLARRQLAFDGIRRRVVGLRFPGAYGKGLASGVLRGRPDAVQGTMTFDEWLRSPDHARG